MLGCLLAIACGLLAGATYLDLVGDETPAPVPVRQTATLAGIAVACSLAIAGLTVIATNSRIAPDQIRAEQPRR